MKRINRLTILKWDLNKLIGFIEFEISVIFSSKHL